jgi:hypothetical protein
VIQKDRFVKKIKTRFIGTLKYGSLVNDTASFRKMTTSGSFRKWRRGLRCNFRMMWRRGPRDMGEFLRAYLSRKDINTYGTYNTPQQPGFSPLWVVFFADRKVTFIPNFYKPPNLNAAHVPRAKH